MSAAGPELTHLGIEGDGGLDADALERVRRLARQRAGGWERALRVDGVPVSRALACGSAQTGLLEGAKPARFGGSPERAPCPWIIELDVRLVLAAGTDLSDRALLARVAAVTGTRLARCEVITRWQASITMGVFYAHHPLTEQTAIEWEVCVNVEPYFETTGYWREVFTDSEIAAQRRSRTLAVRGGVSRSDYELLKARQGELFRWRLCMAIAHLPAEALPLGLRGLAADLRRFPAVEAMINQARAGRLPRPADLPWARRAQTPVSPPGWVALLPCA